MKKHCYLKRLILGAVFAIALSETAYAAGGTSIAKAPDFQYETFMVG